MIDLTETLTGGLDELQRAAVERSTNATLTELEQSELITAASRNTIAQLKEKFIAAGWAEPEVQVGEDLQP